MNYTKTILLIDFPNNSSKMIVVNGERIAFFHYDGKISAIGNSCLHKGGSLSEGFIQTIDNELYVACPWHGWQYNIVTGKAPNGFKDRQANYEIKIEDGYVCISDELLNKPFKAKHETDPLSDLRNLEFQTKSDSLNVLGISITNLNNELPRTSTSELALQNALQIAESEFGAKTKLIKLRDLNFRHCEGYYSKNEHACTWPCSISEMDPNDGMNEVYRSMILWADVVILSTPIRWGNASSLYYKMAERLNAVQNQITLHDKILVKNKVASFIVTGGQDNIQGVVGQLNTFFTDLGFTFPPFNFVGWSRGWIAEDMENNVEQF